VAEAIQYFHSLSSPWAYLGGPRLHEIAARYRVAIVCRPITVLTENGGILLRTRPEPRQRYHALELDRWRRYLGMELTEPHPAPLPDRPEARRPRRHRRAAGGV